MKTYTYTLEFTKAEIEQLMDYILAREREDWYYGRKDYYEKRHKSIKTKICNIQTL